MFSSVFRGAGACRVRKQLINSFASPTWACAAGFNNNNYNNNNNNNKHKTKGIDSFVNVCRTMEKTFL